MSSWVCISARHCSGDAPSCALVDSVPPADDVPVLLSSADVPTAGGADEDSFGTEYSDCEFNDCTSADGLSDWNKLVSIPSGQFSGLTAGTEMGTDADAARSSPPRSPSIGVFDADALGDGVEAASDELCNLLSIDLLPFSNFRPQFQQIKSVDEVHFMLSVELLYSHESVA